MTTRIPGPIPVTAGRLGRELDLGSLLRRMELLERDHERRVGLLERQTLDARLVVLEAERATTRLEITSAVTVSTASTTVIDWDGELRDDLAGWVAGTPARITVPTDGIYAVSAGCVWAGNTTGNRILYVRRNGANLVGNLTSLNASNTTPQSVGTEIACTANDYFDVTVFQNSGGNLDVTAVAATFLAVTRLRTGLI